MFESLYSDQSTPAFPKVGVFYTDRVTDRAGGQIAILRLLRAPFRPLRLPFRFPESGRSAQVLATSRTWWAADSPVLEQSLEMPTRPAGCSSLAMTFESPMPDDTTKSSGNNSASLGCAWLSECPLVLQGLVTGFADERERRHAQQDERHQ